MFYMDIKANAKFALYNINGLVYITQLESVYCAVRIHISFLKS